MRQIVGRLIVVALLISSFSACDGGGGVTGTMPQAQSGPVTQAQSIIHRELARQGPVGSAATTIPSMGCQGDIVKRFAGRAAIGHSGASTNCASQAADASAPEDNTKTITAIREEAVNAVTFWYVLSCAKSGGTGTMSVGTAPKHGKIIIHNISAVAPGCPAGSPPLPATQALYTWTDKNPAYTTDYFTIAYSVAGQSIVTDISAELAALKACSITATDEASPPTDTHRTTIGVRELVKLETSSSGGATWQVTSGKGTVSYAGVFTAPFANDTSVVTATPTTGALPCSINLKTVQPDGLQFFWLKSLGYAYRDGFSSKGRCILMSHLLYCVGDLAVVLMTPGNVSFNNIDIQELDGSPPVTHFNTIITLPDGSQGWLVGCDDNQRTSLVDQSFTNYWAFESGGDQTKFSQTRTTLLNNENDYVLKKGQVAALATDGNFVDTPGQQTSRIDVPKDSTGSSLGSTTNCPTEARALFSDAKKPSGL